MTLTDIWNIIGLPLYYVMVVFITTSSTFANWLHKKAWDYNAGRIKDRRVTPFNAGVSTRNVPTNIDGFLK